MVGPKAENKTSGGRRFHAKNDPYSTSWALEEDESSIQAIHQPLFRVLVGKIADRDKVFTTLREVPVVQNDPDWNCVQWVKGALSALQKGEGAMSTSRPEWQTVRDTAMVYREEKKRKHRFDGKGNFDMSKHATYDLLQGRETIL